MFTSQLRAAAVMTVLLCLLTGVAYPTAVTAVAQLLFPEQANGSFVSRDGRVAGSRLIGQRFSSSRYFHGRPSAAGYDANASSGSNKGPTDSTLLASIAARVDTLVAGGAGKGEIPADLVTASASGLDPHISPASAALQVNRVATARGVSRETVAAMVSRFTEGRQFGVLGEPRVNVLMLNLALDSASNAAGASR